MPEAFIVSKTSDTVSIDFGGKINGVFVDGHVEIKKGESFHDWTFEELQEEMLATIIYQNPQEGNDE